MTKKLMTKAEIDLENLMYLLWLITRDYDLKVSTEKLNKWI
jgi:hypothetical protein